MLIFRPFTAQALKLNTFTCGEPALDDWLVQQAGQSSRRNNTKTTLLLDERASRIVGFYSMRTFEVSTAETASVIGRTLRYPIPAMLIAKFAVDVAYQHQGIGRLLLLNALENLLDTANSVGFELIIVHALHEDAESFYLKYGFRRFHDHELHLFLTTKNLRATLTGTNLG